MNGKVTITVENVNVRYEITLEHNISILSGYSGSGKSYMCSLINQKEEGDSGVTVSVSCNASVIIMPKVTLNKIGAIPWHTLIKTNPNAVFIIDETCDCFKGKPHSFSEVIKHTPNYYLLIQRDTKFDYLPFSIHALYHLEEGEKVATQTIIRNVQTIKNYSNENFEPSYVITEDSTSGFIFFDTVLSCEVKSSNSKTRIAKALDIALRQGKTNIAVIADGAVFGPHLKKIYGLMTSSNAHILLFFPESFEWLLLHSIYFTDNHHIQEVINNAESLIDYTKHFSLEGYFLEELVEACKAMGVEYAKIPRLSSLFLLPGNLRELQKEIPFTINIE